MDKPRRRAAVRPAGPPSAPVPVADPSTALPVDAGGAAVPDHRDAGRPADGPDATAGNADDTPGSIDPPQHRRRQRAPRQSAAGRAADDAHRGQPSGADGPTAGAADTTADAVTSARTEVRDDRRREDRRRGESAIERSLRALVSTRTTQVPFDVAMRAREVADPSAQDLADAERELVLVRRHYVPPAPLAKKTDAAGRSGAARAEDATGRRGGRRSGRG